MVHFDDVARLLSAATLAGGADEAAIQEAESKLGVRFPASYRWFLANCGAALCDGFEIAGLFDVENDGAPPLWSHVVTHTLQVRRACKGLIPNGYVPFSDDGGDHTFYLDTTRPNDQGEPPIVALGPGADAVVVARDFFDFVIRSFERTLSF